MVCHNWQGALTSELPAEDFLFSAGGGFLFGAVAGYAVKKVMKLAAIVIVDCLWLDLHIYHTEDG
jgi:uncharacterized membrane protein (Fun14 family)